MLRRMILCGFALAIGASALGATEIATGKAEGPGGVRADLIFADGFETGDCGRWSSGDCQVLDLGCGDDGRSCRRAADCCSGFCDASATCSSAGTCAQIGQPCSTDRECCSDLCNGVTCEDPESPVTCTIAGEACGSNAECCSGSCGTQLADRCDRRLYCRVSGEICANSDQCCSGVCEEVGGIGVLTCRPLDAFSCTTMGELCATNGECCSQRCDADVGDLAGKRCQLVGGCLIDGERCLTDLQCCSGSCVVSAVDGVQRCQVYSDLMSCIPTGDQCFGDSTACCSYPEPGHGENLCYKDDGGASVWRCHDSTSDGQGTCWALGESCALAADCCDPTAIGPLCLPDVDHALMCLPECVATWDECTIDSDCCDFPLAACAPFAGRGLCVPL